MAKSRAEHFSLIQRHPDNPIITADDLPYAANSVFNAGATRLKDGTTLLLMRVEDLRGHSHLTAARSANGVDGWQIDQQPTMLPDVDGFPEEVWGIEDPRITYVPEMEKYAILYTSYSRGGPGVSMALTEDFRSFERLGVVMPPEDKDAALLPHRINGEWALIHRPVGFFGAHMWVSYSMDLKYWGNHHLMLEARRGAWWDANKIGLNAPPIETERGWLTLYHGVRTSCAGCMYRVGLALFDLQRPDVCLVGGESWVFGPEADYERVGDVGYVVFPCGTTTGDDGDTLNIYYGAADMSMCLATSSISRMLDWLDENGRVYAIRKQGEILTPQGQPLRDQDRRI